MTKIMLVKDHQLVVARIDGKCVFVGVYNNSCLLKDNKMDLLEALKLLDHYVTKGFTPVDA